MAYTSIIGIRRRRKNFTGDGANKIKVARYNSKAHTIKPLCFIIGKDILQDMRWIKGDRIDILVDDTDNTCIMRRVQKNGLALQITKYGAGRVAIGGIEGTNPETTISIDYQIIDNEIVFDKCW